MAIERCHVCDAFIEDDEAFYDADHVYCENCTSLELFEGL